MHVTMFPLLVQTVTTVKLFNALVKLVTLGVLLNQNALLYHHAVSQAIIVETV